MRLSLADIAQAQQDEAVARRLADLKTLLKRYPLPELADKRIFITGATGFVGYWLLLAIETMNQQGANIHGCALSRHPDMFLSRCPEFRDISWLKWIKGDIRSYRFPKESFDAFIHGATDTSPEAAAQPSELLDTIIEGTRHVLDHAVASGTRRVLLLSSGAIYGEQPQSLDHIQENYTGACDPLDYRNAYGEGKRIMEMLGATYSRTHDIEPVVARCFAFVGHGLPAHLAIGQFIRDAQENECIVVNGDGAQVRSFLYAADLAVWLLALLSRGKSGRAYNVGSPHGSTLAEVARIVQEIVAPGKSVKFSGSHVTTTRHRYVPDTSAAEHELGLYAWTNLHDAIRKTGEFLKIGT